MHVGKRIICLSCGRITETLTGFCYSCHSPLGKVLAAPTSGSDGLLMGYTESNAPFTIPLDRLGHVAFYGQTFLGKSHHAMHLAKQLNQAGVSLAVVDRAGTWKRLIPDLQGETLLFDALTNLQINPFDLNDRGLVELLLKETIFKGIEHEYADVSPQMNFVLNQCISMSKSIPDLVANVASYTSQTRFRLRNLDATKTALFVRLEPYLTNPILAKIFYCEQSSIDLARLGKDRTNVFVDLYSLHKMVAYRKEIMLAYNFIASAYLRNALSKPDKPRQQIDNAFVVDEAQMLVPRIFKKVTAADSWATTDFAVELLKRGHMLCIITQFPTSIEEDIIKNIHHNFIYRLQDAGEIRRIAGLFGYTQQEAVSYIGAVLSNLQRQWSLVRTSLWSNPFLLKSPLLLLREADLAKFMPVVQGMSADMSLSDQMEDDEGETIFLASIKAEPFIPAAERRRRLGFDKARYAEVVEALVGKGIVEKVHVRQPTGRPVVLYQLKGARPSVEHEYYLHWISEELRSMGLAVTRSDHRDLMVKGNKSIVIEYETGTSDFLQNIEAGLKVADVVISTSVDDAVLNLVRNATQKVEFTANRVFVEKVWDVPQLAFTLL